jgi:hypothetical protein
MHGDPGRMDAHSKPSRRALLIGSAAVAAVSAAAAEPASDADADAEIIALVNRIMATDAESNRLEAEFEEQHPDASFSERWSFRDKKISPAVQREWDDRALLAGMQATTLAGFRAKAVVVQTFNNCSPGYATGYEDDALAWSLANDVLRVG